MTQWKERVAYGLGALFGIDSAKSIVRRKFEVLARRGVDVRVIYGDSDEGLEGAATYLGDGFRWFKQLACTQAQRNSRMDHALFLSAARNDMMDAVEHQLTDQASRMFGTRKALARKVGENADTVILALVELHNSSERVTS